MSRTVEVEGREVRGGPPQVQKKGVSVQQNKPQDESNEQDGPAGVLPLIVS